MNLVKLQMGEGAIVFLLQEIFERLDQFKEMLRHF
jgi:hypothetical protein